MESIDEEFSYWFRGFGNATQALKVYESEPDDEYEICSECGAPISDDFFYCPSCGQKAVVMNEDPYLEDR